MENTNVWMWQTFLFRVHLYIFFKDVDMYLYVFLRKNRASMKFGLVYTEYKINSGFKKKIDHSCDFYKLWNIKTLFN